MGRADGHGFQGFGVVLRILGVAFEAADIEFPAFDRVRDGRNDLFVLAAQRIGLEGGANVDAKILGPAAAIGQCLLRNGLAVGFHLPGPADDRRFSRGRPGRNLIDRPQSGDLPPGREAQEIDRLGHDRADRLDVRRVDADHGRGQLPLGNPFITELDDGVGQSRYDAVIAKGGRPSRSRADEGDAPHLRGIGLVGRIGVGVVPLVGPGEILDSGHAHGGIVEAEVVAAAGGPVDEVAKGVFGPVLLPEGNGEELPPKERAGPVVEVDDVVGPPDVVEHGLGQSVVERRQMAGTFAHGEERIVLAQGFADHVHVDVDGPFIGDAGMLFDELVGPRNLVGPQEVEGAARRRQFLGGNQLGQGPQDLQFHDTAGHVVVGAPFEPALEEVPGEDDAFLIRLGPGDPGVDPFELLGILLHPGLGPDDDLAAGLYQLEQFRPLAPGDGQGYGDILGGGRHSAGIENLVGIEVAVLGGEYDHPCDARGVQRRKRIGARSPDQGQLAFVLIVGSTVPQLLGFLGGQGRGVEKLPGDVAGLGTAADERRVRAQAGHQTLFGFKRPELPLQGIIGRPRAGVAFDFDRIDAVPFDQVEHPLRLFHRAAEFLGLADPGRAGQADQVVERELSGDFVGQNGQDVLRERSFDRRAGPGGRRSLAENGRGQKDTGDEKEGAI